MAGQRWAPHVTVAVVAACPDTGRLLMVREHQGGRLVLNQPAGHLEPGETLLEAARRECLEETGWEVEPTGLVGIHQWEADNGTPYLRFTFAATPLRHHPGRPLDTGIVAAVWMAPEEVLAAPDLRSPLVARCVRHWRERAPHPLSVVESV